MTRRSNFTLLEILLGVALLALFSGAIGWKVVALINRGRFQVNLDKVEQLLIQSRMTALNTKSDWVLSFYKNRKGWIADLSCREDPQSSDTFGRSVYLGEFGLDFEGASKSSAEFFFYSSGNVEPVGILSMKQGALSKTLDLGELFHQYLPSEVSPAHPDDLIQRK